MSSNKSRIAIISIDQRFKNILAEYLADERFDCFLFNPSEALKLAYTKKNYFDLLVLDADYLELEEPLGYINQIKSYQAGVKSILISFRYDPQYIADILKDGVDDFIKKPVDTTRFLESVYRLLEKDGLSEEKTFPSTQKDVLKDHPTKYSPSEHRSPIHLSLDAFLGPIKGNSVEIKKLNNQIDLIAPSDTGVMITGELGTEKDWAAKRIHNLSQFSTNRFIQIECAGLTADELSEQLIGLTSSEIHQIDSPGKGALRYASRGSLYFSNIDELDSNAQATLFRLFKKYVFSDSHDAFFGNKIVCRLICSSTKSLNTLKKKELFRADLFYFFATSIIKVPSLAERRNDIPLLAEDFLESFIVRNPQFRGRSFSPEALKKLQNSDWPENTIQLKSVVQQLCLSLTHPLIMASDISQVRQQQINDNVLEKLFEQTAEFQQYKDVTEKLFLHYYLDKYAWNISQTADAIGIQRSHLYNKIKKYKLNRV